MPTNSPNDSFGSVGGYSDVVPVTPVLTVAGAYIAGDYIGMSSVPMTFANALRLPGGSGIVYSCVLIDRALQSKGLELWLFDSTVTPPADNAAWTITDADAAKCIGVISLDTYFASAANSITEAANIGLAFELPAGSVNLFGCLVSRGTPTYASLDITIKLGILQD